MNSDNDLLHQPHPINQKPNSSFKSLKPLTLLAVVFFIALVAETGGYLLGARNKQLVFPSQPGTTITQFPPITIQQPTSFPTSSSSNHSATIIPIPTTSPEIDTSDWKTYRNEKYRFGLTFPKDWYLPSATDSNPHFYDKGECVNNYRISYAKLSCSGLEIQNQTGGFSEGWEATFNSLKTEGRNPIKLSSLIPEAIVIKSDAPGSASGWGIQYDIFFQTDKRRFLIFANRETLERYIISTFRLIN